MQGDQIWELEIPIFEKDIENWKEAQSPSDISFLATAARRARSEVKLKELGQQEAKLFEAAKLKELSAWLETKTFKRILRSKMNPEQILRCRWILTWKKTETGDKAKARLVVLDFQDPDITEVPKDAPHAVQGW